MSKRITSPRVIEGMLRGAEEALSGAGAISNDPAVPVTAFTSTDAAQALTIADGKHLGQKKRIVHVVDGGSGVITASSTVHLARSLSTITFTNVRDWVDLVWTADGWDPVAYSGATFS